MVPRRSIIQATLRGSLLNIQLAVLVRSRRKALFKSNTRKRDYFWTALYFNGLCIYHKLPKGRQAMIILRSHKDDLNGITGYFFTSAPNLLSINADMNIQFRLATRSHKVFIRHHHKSLRRLRLRFSA